MEIIVKNTAIGNALTSEILANYVNVTGCALHPFISSKPNVKPLIIVAPFFSNGLQPIAEGNLVMFGNSKEKDFFMIDNMGHLVVSGLNAQKYAINENGNLLYNYCI